MGAEITVVIVVSLKVCTDCKATGVYLSVIQLSTIEETEYCFVVLFSLEIHFFVDVYSLFVHFSAFPPTLYKFVM